eukprot:CAMPEP_0118928056 /NCGR_PEP_ID=MMETSP1169-20130426/5398_1 /TAXON_ID=36882 /ORGANISM="Pyramimonas obovata, Strain CCMP722" /LENGTH=115 /DNA_ID=CAMNT_0006869951 /DNA_START=61 /DNA_END=408 /DNA_ORIENTATION=+
MRELQAAVEELEDEPFIEERLAAEEAQKQTRLEGIARRKAEAEAEAEVQKAKLERAVIEEKKMKEALLQHLEAESRKEYALFSDDENVADLDAQARRMAKMAELARKELGIVEDQ